MQITINTNENENGWPALSPEEHRAVPGGWALLSQRAPVPEFEIGYWPINDFDGNQRVEITTNKKASKHGNLNIPDKGKRVCEKELPTLKSNEATTTQTEETNLDKPTTSSGRTQAEDTEVVLVIVDKPPQQPLPENESGCGLLVHITKATINVYTFFVLLLIFFGLLRVCMTYMKS